MLKGWLWRSEYEAKLSSIGSTLEFAYHPKSQPPKQTSTRKPRKTTKCKRAALEDFEQIEANGDPKSSLASASERPAKRTRSMATTAKTSGATTQTLQAGKKLASRYPLSLKCRPSIYMIQPWSTSYGATPPLLVPRHSRRSLWDYHEPSAP